MSKTARNLQLPQQPRKLDVLTALEPHVTELVERHLRKRRLWFPSELLADQLEQGNGQELRRAAAELPGPIRVSLALNLLTEEGLPHFHRLIALHLDEGSIWQRWNFIWTAEEDRHGCLLRDYVKASGLYDCVSLERLQHSYVEAGFTPEWERDPYRLLAYTSLQERATQIAHSNTGKAAREVEPQLSRLLGKIAADEARHYGFYREVFAKLLQFDPDRALQSLLKVMPALTMPGHSIPGFSQMAAVVETAGIYGPRDYLDIVKELLEYWRIEALDGLRDTGQRARAALLELPVRLEKLIQRRERTHLGDRSAEFSFLPGLPVRY